LVGSSGEGTGLYVVDPAGVPELEGIEFGLRKVLSDKLENDQGVTEVVDIFRPSFAQSITLKFVSEI
jgi:hypothetical protein